MRAKDKAEFNWSKIRWLPHRKYKKGLVTASSLIELEVVPEKAGWRYKISYIGGSLTGPSKKTLDAAKVAAVTAARTHCYDALAALGTYCEHGYDWKYRAECPGCAVGMRWKA
jgi:hypothetical protein